MPRQSRSSRPSARPAAPSAPSGSRQASTAAYPTQHAPPPAMAGAGVQQRQPGMLASMASTMGGAMAGSVVGHGISNMLFGGSGHQQAPPPAEIQQPVNQSQWQGQSGASCDIQAKDFTRCLEAGGDINSCGYYLEALKACQAAAARY